jgi:hypothetical protein
MTRILIVQTASPKRICAKAEQLLKTGMYPDLELFILCNEKDGRRFRNLPQTTVLPMQFASPNKTVHDLLRATFDLTFVFWTGEKKYRPWKLLALRLKLKNTCVIGGDGNEFRLTWKAICRHAVFRLRHPLPTDHYGYLDDVDSEALVVLSDSHIAGEKVLIVQSAEPPYILKALENLRANPQFKDPSFTIFCRNKPEIVSRFQGNPLLHRIVTHSETQNSFRHLLALRRQRFDAAVLFLTGDPSYWKVKMFAFLLGTRRILIFNEETDCFFFNFHQWLALISHRIRVRPHPAASSKWGYSTRILVFLILKSVIFPFRFLWLLLVWLRLRAAGLRSSRESHDYSL